MVFGLYYYTFADLGGMGGGIPIVLLKVPRYVGGLKSTITLLINGRDSPIRLHSEACP